MEIGSKFGCLTVLEIGKELIKCQCKCGKIQYYDINTVESAPKYCRYPMFISARMTYSIPAQNANYNKRKKFDGLMNVVLVEKRTDCKMSDEYCGLWNNYKRKQQNRKDKTFEEKLYTIKELDRKNKGHVIHEVYASSHLLALKKLYPNDDFELCPKSDVRNSWILMSDYDFEVSNHYGNSAQSRSRRYKKITKNDIF